jgi:putative hydrolase of HD superfamily
MDTITKILEILRLAEGLKRELRHSWLSDGRQESVADHTYQMALMAVLVAPYLDTQVDLERTLKLVIYHDLVEAVTGDVPFFEEGDRKEQKAARERKAIERIRDGLPVPVGEEVYDLWFEFEEGISPEAKFARALDNLEVQLQHNLAALDTWNSVEHELVYTKMDRHCEHDRFLKRFCEAIKKDAEEKLIDGGISIDELKARIAHKAAASTQKLGSR